MRVGGTAPHFLPMMVRARARRICWRNRAGPTGRPISRGPVPGPPRRPAMSLKPTPIDPVPDATARVARAAFRKGNPLLKLCDELSAIFADADFADLFPKRGRPGLAPWRLALVTLLQFREDLVDAAYVDAELLVRSREDHGIDLVGPPRGNPSWQGKVEGGHTIDRFEVDWDAERVRCPQGKLSSAWSPQVDHAGTPYVSVMFRPTDCGACPARPLCTRAKHGVRHLKLQPRAEYEALRAARGRLATREGRRAYARRAGIEGTISQGVRAFGLRRSRYRGLARTHLQHVATAAAINLA